MTHRGLVIGYHGCDATVRDKLVTGELQTLKASANRYDWLGPGIYFFENDAARALTFAEASSAKPEALYTANPIATPAVVGAVIRVERWLDMTTQEGLNTYKTTFQEMQKKVDKKEVQGMPTNQRTVENNDVVLLRQLDNAVLTKVHSSKKELGEPSLQGVRGIFEQGTHLSENSGFRSLSHIQIAIDPSCIHGWFLPVGTKLLTPQEREVAELWLAEAVEKRREAKRAAGKLQASKSSKGAIT